MTQRLHSKKQKEKIKKKLFSAMNYKPESDYQIFNIETMPIGVTVAGIVSTANVSVCVR